MSNSCVPGTIVGDLKVDMIRSTLTTQSRKGTFFQCDKCSGRAPDPDRESEKPLRQSYQPSGEPEGE